MELLVKLKWEIHNEGVSLTKTHTLGSYLNFRLYDVVKS